MNDKNNGNTNDNNQQAPGKEVSSMIIIRRMKIPIIIRMIMISRPLARRCPKTVTLCKNKICPTYSDLVKQIY